jgi:hypothetical protein
MQKPCYKCPRDSSSPNVLKLMGMDINSLYKGLGYFYLDPIPNNPCVNLDRTIRSSVHRPGSFGQNCSREESPRGETWNCFLVPYRTLLYCVGTLSYRRGDSSHGPICSILRYDQVSSMVQYIPEPNFPSVEYVKDWPFLRRTRRPGSSIRRRFLDFGSREQLFFEFPESVVQIWTGTLRIIWF